MLLWSSEFPTAIGCDADDVLRVAKRWIVGSPHASWRDEDFSAEPVDEVLEFPNGDQVVHVGRVATDEGDWVGFRWSQTDPEGREWRTQIVGVSRKPHLYVSIRVNCHLTAPGMKLPRAKKPYIVRQILQELGGGRDGPFTVQDRPHLLEEHEIPVAAALVAGNAGNSLPVIYFSSSRKDDRLLDPENAARWFSGMAHVVVEPSRPFSFTLARETDGKNAYDGAIGILWPGGLGRTLKFFPNRYRNRTDLGLAIGDSLRNALTHIQPTSERTWTALSERISRKAIEALQAKGSTKVEDYVEAFDSEIAAKNEKIAALSDELQRIRNDLLIAEASAAGQEGASLLRSGEETPLYPGEIQDALLTALKKGQELFPNGSRRRHIIEDVLQHNDTSGTDRELADAVSAALSSLEKFGRSERRALEELGFDIDEDGKHVQAIYRNDRRYTFTIPKTPSDHRSGKNCAATINRTLF